LEMTFSDRTGYRVEGSETLSLTIVYENGCVPAVFRKMTLAQKILAASGALVVAAGVGIIVNALGDPASVNGTSTKTYLDARYSFVQASKALLPNSHMAVDSVVTNISAGCSHALRKAPAEPRVVREGRDESVALRPSTRELLLQEARAVVEAALLRPRGRKTESFIDKVKKLRWSDHELTRAVHSLADVEAATLHMRMPKLCDDVEEWVASGFRRVPTNAKRSEPAFETAIQNLSNALMGLGCKTGNPSNAILQLLEPYEHGNEEPTSSGEMQRLETKMRATEYAIMGNAIARIEHALGLPRQADSRTVVRPYRTARDPVLSTQECRAG
jgi:hypothetical protein